MYAYYIICILTIEKNALPPPHPSLRPPRPNSVRRPPLGTPPLLHTRFSPTQLLRRFHQLLPVSLLAGWLALSERAFYQRAFTPLVTLWYLVFQRLDPNHALSHVQDDARDGGADRLSPPGKPLSRQITSESTSAYSDARQRLPLSFLLQTLGHVAAQFGRAFQGPLSFGLRIALLDGSTFRLRPFGDIPQHFPPHRPGNCTKPPYWCVARVVGALCWATGAVLDTALGSLKQSEQALCAGLLQARSWAGWLLLGDRNFGVYSVARSIVAAQGQALLRMTEVRARKLARTAGWRHQLRPGLDLALDWSPSARDQYPEGITPAPVPGRLLVAQIRRPGYRPLRLYLFTTLLDPVPGPVWQLVELYAQRWNIEVYFRYIKAQMDLDFLEPHSADLARKEWLAGMIAYNLIRWAMAAAAARAKVPVLRLSFCRARSLLLGWLDRSPRHRRSTRSWSRLLNRISQAQQPKRRKRRPSEPRAVRLLKNHFPVLEGTRAAAREKLAKAHANS